MSDPNEDENAEQDRLDAEYHAAMHPWWEEVPLKNEYTNEEYVLEGCMRLCMEFRAIQDHVSKEDTLGAMLHCINVTEGYASLFTVLTELATQIQMAQFTQARLERDGIPSHIVEIPGVGFAVVPDAVEIPDDLSSLIGGEGGDGEPPAAPPS